MAGKKARTTVAEKGTERAEPRFTKQQIISAARYKDRKDLVSALLDDSGTYTLEEVDWMVDRFMEGKVK